MGPGPGRGRLERPGGSPLIPPHPDQEDSVYALSFVLSKMMEKEVMGQGQRSRAALHLRLRGLPSLSSPGAGDSVPVSAWDHFHTL